MSKNKYGKSFSKPIPPSSIVERSTPPNLSKEAEKSPISTPRDQKSAGVRPEQISLMAHKHIHEYMNSQEIQSLSQDDLNAVLRLSQHLRVFGLLSAIGYVNQSNAQEGKVRLRTVPVWSSLLGQLASEDNFLESKALMGMIQTLANDRPPEYLALWRRSLILSNHWNFWARAYLSGDANVHRTSSN